MKNRIYFGDNLEILREFPSQSVELVYLDPPFNSGRNYNTFLRQSQAQKKAFTDIWKWDDAAREARAFVKAQTSGTYQRLDKCLYGYDQVLQKATTGNKGSTRAYLAFMGPRLAELHRILKETGSIYLHCDATASHYLKGIMDAIWDEKNQTKNEHFRNEIIWKRTGAHSDGNQYGRIHDTILFYSKSGQTIWNPVYRAHDSEYIKKNYNYEDERGYYQVVSLNAAGVTQEGESGQPWRGVNPSDVGRHWSTPQRKAWPEDVEPPENYESLSVHDKLDTLDAKGLIYWPPKGKTPRFKRYLSTSKGVLVQDIITDINPIAGNAKENMNYDTQKPRALLERIISASSNEGNIVLDPFCGGGTTLDAAETLNRRWIGIDLTILALDPVQKRLRDRHGLEPSIDYEINGYPTNLQEAIALANHNKRYHDFANWAVTRLGLEPTPDSGDGGFDGTGNVVIWENRLLKEAPTKLKVIAEVKSGKKPTKADVRAFCASMHHSDAKFGIFITLHPITKGMRDLQDREGTIVHNGRPYPRLQFWQIDDAYFDAPESLNQIVKLPWRIESRPKSERHFGGTQQEIAL